MSGLIHASDKLLQLQKLQDEPMVERIKTLLTKYINKTTKFPVTLKLNGELFVEESEFAEMIEPLVLWLDNKGYRLTYQEAGISHCLILSVNPK